MAKYKKNIKKWMIKMLELPFTQGYIMTHMGQ
jgi:hypothetical protein